MEKEDGNKLGWDAYIAKPIRYKEFLKVVAQSLSV
jgi:DNA-binding response OmpR family regulator